jgi:hypothetical protein
MNIYVTVILVKGCLYAHERTVQFTVTLIKTQKGILIVETTVPSLVGK